MNRHILIQRKDDRSSFGDDRFAIETSTLSTKPETSQCKKMQIVDQNRQFQNQKPAEDKKDDLNNDCHSSLYIQNKSNIDSIWLSRKIIFTFAFL